MISMDAIIILKLASTMWQGEGGVPKKGKYKCKVFLAKKND